MLLLCELRTRQTLCGGCLRIENTHDKKLIVKGKKWA